MLFKVGHPLAAALIVSLLIQIQIATIGHAELEEIESKVVFTSWLDDGNIDIFVIEGDVKKEVRLTKILSGDYNPTWSPNGKKIAFVSTRKGGFLNIWVMNADGTDQTKLTDGFWDNYPDWSPDGKYIAYQHLRPELIDDPHARVKKKRYQIKIIKANGRFIRTATAEGSIHPSWSPDGTQIAFSWGEQSKPNQICVVDAFGSSWKQLTDDSVYKQFPTWSPDGTKIAYAGGSRIWVMNSNGENQKQVTWKGKDDFQFATDEHPTWSPDGGSIAFHATRGNGRLRIYVVNLTSGAIIPMRDIHGISNYQPDWYDPRQLSVSPAGRQITIWGKLKVR